MTEVTPVMVVDRMLEILAKPENWTKGEYARNARGVPVEPDSPVACKFCISGARCRALVALFSLQLSSLVADAMHEEAFASTTHSTGPAFNDAPETTHADILDYLKAVRARLEATCTV